jgi:excinuclease UvrABC nuclease subunit
MISERLKNVLDGESGVYCMFDLDAEPAYAGQTSNLRSRLKQHFYQARFECSELRST